MKTMEITVRGVLLTVTYNPDDETIDKVYAAECDNILPLLAGPDARIEIYNAVSNQIKLDQINEAYEADVEARYHQGRMPGDAELWTSLALSDGTRVEIMMIAIRTGLMFQTETKQNRFGSTGITSPTGCPCPHDQMERRNEPNIRNAGNSTSSNRCRRTPNIAKNL